MQNKIAASQQIYEFCEEHGPMTAREISDITGHAMSSVWRAHRDGYLVRSRISSGRYEYGAKPKQDESVVPPRSVNVLTRPELNDYFGSIRRRLRVDYRDISFLTTSAKFQNK